MTKEQLYKEKEIAVERYGRGYILADYSGRRGDASYRGISMNWRRQAIIDDPFETEEAAITAGMKDGL